MPRSPSDSCDTCSRTRGGACSAVSNSTCSSGRSSLERACPARLDCDSAARIPEQCICLMPRVSFDGLPDSARVWVFGSDDPVSANSADRLLGDVDAFLDRWNAHGFPLTCARDWRDDHFLAIGVDQSTAGASGCS